MTRRLTPTCGSGTKPEKPMCIIDGCGRPARAKGMCDTHYRRVLRTGHADGPIATRTPSTVAASRRVECGDCGRVVAFVFTDRTVWQALAAHTCHREETP